MRKLFIFIIGLTLLTTLVAGCGKSSGKMRQSKIKNPQGLAVQGPQIGKEDRGKAVIIITEEMKYPGMERYQTAEYQFTSKDTPQKVAEWFESNLSGSRVKQRTGSQDGRSKWTVTYKKYIIDIVSYDAGSLIMYKRDLD